MEITEEKLLEFGEKAAAKALEQRKEELSKAVGEAINTSVPEAVKTEVARNITPELMRKSAQSQDERVERMHLVTGFIKAVAKKDFNAVENLAKNHEALYFGLNKAAFSDLTDGQGGFLVPEAWSNEIFSLTQNYGFMRRLARVVPMSTKKENLPTGGGVLISYPDENNSAPQTDATNYFTNTQLEAKLMAAAIVVKQDFLDDAQPSMVEFFTQEVAKAFAFEEDRQGFAGTGAPFTGLINTGGIKVSYMGGANNSGKTSFAAISWQDLVDVSESIDPDKQVDAAFFMSQSVFKAVRKEADANGRPINEMSSVLNIMSQAGMIPKIGINGIGANSYTGPSNYPIYVLPNGVFPTDAPDTPAVVFGSLRQYALMGVRQDMTQKFFDQSYNGLDLAGRNMVAYASMQRKGYSFPVPSAFAVLKTSAT